MKTIRITTEELDFLLRLPRILLETPGVQTQPFYADLRMILRTALILHACWDRRLETAVMILSEGQWQLIADLLLETAAWMQIRDEQEGETIPDSDYRSLYVKIQCVLDGKTEAL